MRLIRDVSHALWLSQESKHASVTVMICSVTHLVSLCLAVTPSLSNSLLDTAQLHKHARIDPEQRSDVSFSPQSQRGNNNNNSSSSSNYQTVPAIRFQALVEICSTEPTCGCYHRQMYSTGIVELSARLPISLSVLFCLSRAIPSGQVVDCLTACCPWIAKWPERTHTSHSQVYHAQVTITCSSNGKSRRSSSCGQEHQPACTRGWQCLSQWESVSLFQGISVNSGRCISSVLIQPTHPLLLLGD